MLHDVRMFYRTFTPFLNNKKVKDKTDITLHIQGTLLQDQRSVAEQFADCFSTVGESSFDNGPAMNLTTEECDRHPSVPPYALDGTLTPYLQENHERGNFFKSQEFEYQQSHWF